MMVMTVNSGVSSYCSPANFVVVQDYRSFAQLASDTDVPLASSSDLQASSILIAALQVAAGDIEMAATVGQRYDPTDLAALVAPTVTNGGWSLIKMNAALAAEKMFERRSEAIPKDIAKQVEDAKMKLAALAEGLEVFPFDQTQAAGIITDYKETAQDVEARNLPSFVARRCLGRRDNRLSPPPY